MNDLMVRIARNRQFLTIAASLLLDSSITKADIVVFPPTNTTTYTTNGLKFSNIDPTQITYYSISNIFLASPFLRKKICDIQILQPLSTSDCLPS